MISPPLISTPSDLQPRICPSSIPRTSPGSRVFFFRLFSSRRRSLRLLPTQPHRQGRPRRCGSHVVFSSTTLCNTTISTSTFSPHNGEWLDTDCRSELAFHHLDLCVLVIGGGVNGIEPAVRLEFLNVPVLDVEDTRGSMISGGRGITLGEAIPLPRLASPRSIYILFVLCSQLDVEPLELHVWLSSSVRSTTPAPVS